MVKGQLLAAYLQQLIAYPQVGNTQLRQIARQHDQREVLRLVTQEETHRFVNGRVRDQMIIIYYQVERAVPLGQFDK